MKPAHFVAVCFIALIGSCATASFPSVPGDAPQFGDAGSDGLADSTPDGSDDAGQDGSNNDGGGDAVSDGASDGAGDAPSDAGVGQACTTYSDCDLPTAPVCSLQTLTCIAGYSACTSDDNEENADDGIAGATAIALSASETSHSGVLCSEPIGGELDFYKVIVTGSAFSVRLAWSLGGEQFKANIYRDNGTSTTFIDATASQPSPQTVHLTGLSAGTYLISVWRVTPSGNTSSSPYSVTVWTP
ncbi:MAG: hypothetical protein IPL79_15175 [Myxococcales bacterium]|nr:hypothetical protein [Myxococcales bacterium]